MDQSQKLSLTYSVFCYKEELRRHKGRSYSLLQSWAKYNLTDQLVSCRKMAYKQTDILKFPKDEIEVMSREIMYKKQLQRIMRTLEIRRRMREAQRIEEKRRQLNSSNNCKKL